VFCWYTHKTSGTKRQVSKHPVSKRQVYKTRQNINGCFFATGRFEDLTFCKPNVLDVLKPDVLHLTF
jgi:hypothetical protein